MKKPYRKNAFVEFVLEQKREKLRENGSAFVDEPKMREDQSLIPFQIEKSENKS